MFTKHLETSFSINSSQIPSQKFETENEMKKNTSELSNNEGECGIKRRKRSQKPQNSHFRPENMRTRIIGYIRKSYLSFINCILRTQGLFAKKMDKNQFGSAAKTHRKRIKEGNFKEMINKKLRDILDLPISIDYTTISDKDNQNKKTYYFFLQKYPDSDLIKIMEEMTIKDFYYHVFINQRNILNEKYENEFKINVITLEKIIQENVKKEKQGFEDKLYVETLREYAKKDFMEYYEKNKY